jgi:peptidyl-dipeptidase Dcp
MTEASSVDLSRHPLTRWTGPLNLPDFSQLSDEAFLPVFEAAFAAHSQEIAAIAANPDAPTIANTLAALELSGEALSHVSSIFWLRAGAHTNDLIQSVERDVAPKMARHYSAISMNPALFARIDALYAQRDGLGLDAETLRVLERSWKDFVRSGAKLDEAGKTRLGAINEELAGLGAQFGQNVLADEKDWALLLDENDVAGLPEFLRGAMAQAAEARGKKGSYAVTLSRSIYEPFTTFSDRRDLREVAFRAFINRGENGGGILIVGDDGERRLTAKRMQHLNFGEDLVRGWGADTVDQHVACGARDKSGVGFVRIERNQFDAFVPGPRV